MKLTNIIMSVLLFLCYGIQLFYIVIGITTKPRSVERSNSGNDYAFLVCARNEERVIKELIESIKAQNYNKDRYDIYVMADNCTDRTADIARNAGARAFTRTGGKRCKGAALDYLYHCIEKSYDGYLVFDADNILDENYLSEMDKMFSMDKYDVITSYRNSKNISDNWISFCNGIWFIKESRLTNHSRAVLGSNTMMAGTGVLISRRVMEQNDGWPFTSLTEDLQFSINCCLNDVKSGYCHDAIIYDEQPTGFSDSWKQRLRWTKGFLEMNKMYDHKLLKSLVNSNSITHFLSQYDVLLKLVTVVLTIVNFGFNMIKLFFMNISEAYAYAVNSLIVYFVPMTAMALLTYLIERKRIRCSHVKGILYCMLFPLFIASYLPITLQAVFTEVEWKQIPHYTTDSFCREKRNKLEII